MKYLMRKKMNKKGFSLIELIVVIAILAIIAAIAIPRFALIQARSEVKSDASTASEIVNSARIYASDNPTVDITTITIAMLVTDDYLPADVANAQSNDPAAGGADFVLEYDGTDGVFYVTWTPDNAYTDTELEQWLVENVPYVLDDSFTF